MSLGVLPFYFLIFFNLFIWLQQDLVPGPGIKPGPPALGVGVFFFFKDLFYYLFNLFLAASGLSCSTQALCCSTRASL